MIQERNAWSVVDDTLKIIDVIQAADKEVDGEKGEAATYDSPGYPGWYMETHTGIVRFSFVVTEDEGNDNSKYKDEVDYNQDMDAYIKDHLPDIFEDYEEYIAEHLQIPCGRDYTAKLEFICLELFDGKRFEVDIKIVSSTEEPPEPDYSPDDSY
jgi:hypothetical protein